jgi:carboxyl-terminal processing protease
MRKFIFFISILSISANLMAQAILNNSFEISSDLSKNIPKFWSYTIGQGNGVETHNLTNRIFAYRDSGVSHSGKYSLKMSVSDPSNFIFGGTQHIEVNSDVPKTIRIAAWLKTKDCKSGAGLNCTQKNSKGEKIGYTSSRQQETLEFNTQEWTKTELIVLLLPEVKSIDLWAFVYGSGTVWFDDIHIEEFTDTVLKPSPVVSAFLDTVISDVKENSLWKDSIDWKILTSQLTALSTGMQTYREAYLLAGYIINELRQRGDNHSIFMPYYQVKQANSSDIQGRGRKVETKYLGEGIGYVSMPGFASLNDSVRIAFATYAQTQIKKADMENKICRWVVDLRDDDGGSFPPMVTGLGPILGEGVFVNDISLKNDTTIWWYRNGECYAVLNGRKDSSSVTKVLRPYILKNANVPVAVLIGAGCGSSGECTVAAFIGRHDTKLFGQPTAGFTKGNVDFILPDSSMIFIAAGIQSDRNGKKYPERIFPDVQVDEPAGSKTDITLEKAKEWLITFGGCK